jgi:hypothetical protein
MPDPRPSTTTLVRAGSIEVPVREAGDPRGRPVVLLHGALVDGSVWDDVVPHLAAAGLRVLVPDLPLGAHRTAVPHQDLSVTGVVALLVDLLAALDLRDVVLVGNDTGGALSQVLVTERPDGVERLGALALTSCDAFGNFPPRAFQPVAPLLRTRSGPRLVRVLFGGRTALRLMIRLVSRRCDADRIEGWRAGLLEPGVAADTARLFGGLDRRRTRAAARELHRVGLPALVAWSGDDLLFPARHGRALAQRLGARHEVVEGARTFSMIDQPAALASLLVALATSAPHRDAAARSTPAR